MRIIFVFCGAKLQQMWEWRSDETGKNKGASSFFLSVPHVQRAFACRVSLWQVLPLSVLVCLGRSLLHPTSSFVTQHKPQAGLVSVPAAPSVRLQTLPLHRMDGSLRFVKIFWGFYALWSLSVASRWRSMKKNRVIEYHDSDGRKAIFMEFFSGFLEKSAETSDFSREKFRCFTSKVPMFWGKMSDVFPFPNPKFMLLCLGFVYVLTS